MRNYVVFLFLSVVLLSIVLNVYLMKAGDSVSGQAGCWTNEVKYCPQPQVKRERYSLEMDVWMTGMWSNPGRRT